MVYSLGEKVSLLPKKVYEELLQHQAVRSERGLVFLGLCELLAHVVVLALVPFSELQMVVLQEVFLTVLVIPELGFLVSVMVAW